MVPGKKTIPVVFVESTSGIIPERRLRATIAARRLLGGGAERQRRLDLPAPVVHLVGEPVERHGHRRHRVPDHHPADRHQVARLRLEHAEAEHEPERHGGGHARARARSARWRSGTPFARPRAVQVPNATIPASRAATSQRLSVSKIAWIT